MRDPRIDPKVGDILRKQRRTRKVTFITQRNLDVMERCDDLRSSWYTYPYLSQWRRWAANAEVLHAAE